MLSCPQARREGNGKLLLTHFIWQLVSCLWINLTRCQATGAKFCRLHSCWIQRKGAARQKGPPWLVIYGPLLWQMHLCPLLEPWFPCWGTSMSIYLWSSFSGLFCLFCILNQCDLGFRLRFRFPVQSPNNLFISYPQSSWNGSVSRERLTFSIQSTN